MACILVYIESDEERIRDTSLHALSAGRRIASTLGATLCAYIQTPASAVDADRFVQALGQAGADKVVVAANDSAAGPARWSNHGETLHSACERMRPMVTVMAESVASRDIAPRLAARLAGDYLRAMRVEMVLAGSSIASAPEPGCTDEASADTDWDLEADTAAQATVEPWDTVVLTRGTADRESAGGSDGGPAGGPDGGPAGGPDGGPAGGPDGGSTGGSDWLRIPVTELRPHSVITLHQEHYPPTRGLDDADAMHMQCAEPQPNAPKYLDRAERLDAELTTARVVVGGGGGVASAEMYRLLGELARALGGQVAATATLCERGVAPANHAIGSRHHRIAPTLYICCGASGSEEHLRGIAPQTNIVAINRDAKAPIFSAARYGIVGDIESVVPALIAALKSREEALS